MSLHIRTRLTLWHGLLVAVMVTALGAFLVLRLRADLVAETDRTLVPAVAQIGHDYAQEGIPEFADTAGTVLKGERAVAQLLSARGRVVTRFGDPAGRRSLLDDAQRRAALAGRPVTATRGAFGVAAGPVRRHGRVEVVVAGESVDPIARSVRRVLLLLFVAGPAAVAATVAGGWWLAGRALRPLRRITASAREIGVRRLDERVPVPASGDEVAELATTLNTMLDRLAAGVDAQRRLVGDASHELRTPLAAMAAELDVSLRAGALSAEARAVLASAREEVRALAGTVDALLTLARLDEDALTRRPQRFGLDDVARDAADALGPLARRRGVAVVCDGEQVAVLADASAVAHAVRNVVDNAVKHSPPGGDAVRVTTSAAGGAGRVTVVDEGRGIPPELRERVFERFFRVDAARTAATGGSGLGLAITRELIEAQRGRVWIDGAATGTAVVIELPLAPMRAARSPAAVGARS